MKIDKVNNPFYIHSSCVICNNKIYKHHQIIFTRLEKNPEDFLFTAYKYFGLNYPRFYKMDSLSKLGWLCSELLLQGCDVKDKYKPGEVGLIFSNATASLSSDAKYFQSIRDIPSPALFVYTLPNIVTGEICIRHGFKGENAFFIFERFDPAFLENYITGLLQNNNMQACICGWIDFFETNYKAALFLVEKNDGKFAVPFSAGKMAEIFNV